MAGRDEEFKRLIESAGLGASLGEASLARRTQRQVVFRGCTLRLQAVTGEVEGKDIVQMYQVLIGDPAENTLYIYRFDEDIRQMFHAFCELPHIGEEFVEDDE